MKTIFKRGRHTAPGGMSFLPRPTFGPAKIAALAVAMVEARGAGRVPVTVPADMPPSDVFAAARICERLLDLPCAAFISSSGDIAHGPALEAALALAMAERDAERCGTAALEALRHTAPGGMSRRKPQRPEPN
jgi:hypothetical protein